MKKQIFLLSIFLLSLVFSLVSFRQVLAREFEVGWPDLPWMDSPTTVAARGEEITIPYFFSYIFNFALMIVGVVALLMLILQAIRYMTSTVAPAKRGEAIEGMKNIGYGLLLLLLSFIILNTINPELVILATPEDWKSLVQEANPLVLYDQANCQGESIGISEDVPNLDSLGWNDKAVSFKVKSGQVVQLCRHADGNPLLCEGPANCSGYCECKIAVGDGKCHNFSTWEGGYLWGCPPLCALCAVNPNIWRLTSVGIGSLNKEALLAVFPFVSLSGKPEILSYQKCKAADKTFNSYWLNANSSAILCNSSWDGCVDGNPATATPDPITTGANPKFADLSGGALCAYPNDTTDCVGFYFTADGPEFVPVVGPCVNLDSNDNSVTEMPAGMCNGRTIILYDDSNCSSPSSAPSIYTHPGALPANKASAQAF